ncbi:MAG TPA: acyl-CoA dehydrogenase family protein [Candidatus Cybelea sp.]|nr:acyl-CoA dehydrogenase family protein [Candidatus Cybelea sp.]
MVPALTADEQRLIDSAKAFTRTVVLPNAARWERERRIARDALKSAAELGFNKIEVPKAHGGLGMSFFAKLRVAEELSRGCMAFAFSLVNTHNCAKRIAHEGTQEQIARFLPALLKVERLGGAALSEPDVGSDFAEIQTTARKTADGWVLNGEKAWITNAAEGDVYFTYAQTEPGSRGRGIACFLVDGTKPGFERVPPFQLMGGHAIGVGGFKLRDYRATGADLIRPAGKAFSVALQGLNQARTYVAAMCCGMLEEALACAVRYGGERQAFGKPLLEHQGLRWKLARVATDLEAARLLTYRAVGLIEAEGAAPRGQDGMLAASFAKKFASEMIVERLSDCMQVMGAAGLREECPIGRHIALARIANYVDGSTEIQNDRIGAVLASRYGAS